MCFGTDYSLIVLEKAVTQTPDTESITAILFFDTV
jgi:hypothetical protein